MNAATTREKPPTRQPLPESHWPHVGELIEGGFTIPKLDLPPAPYPPERLREWASACEATDPDLAAFLTEIADTPRALAQMNLPDKERRNLNIALHLLIATRLLPAKQQKAARARIASAWGVSEAYVKEIRTVHHDVAHEWLKNLLEHLELRAEFAAHDEIIAALDADLTLRAAAMPRKKGQ